MSRKFLASLPALLILIIASAVSGQTPAPSTTPPPAPGLRKLTGDDERRAQQLDEQIDQALKQDRWKDAIARAEELVALRGRVQGPKHFETVNEEWRLKAMRRLDPMPKEDRLAYQSASTMTEQGDTLDDQGKYAAAQPLLEKALEIRRRLLSDDHPDTALSYGNVAGNLHSQGKYAQAERLFEKALQIDCRLLTDDHPRTASAYSWLAATLYEQGKYAQAQPLYTRALEIDRRLLSDDHPHTATNYSNLALNLNAQGKHAQAQPLLEKALEIRRRLLSDDHPDTAGGYNNVALNLNAQGKYAAA
jgi:tetratricopeptide (TPR) repeat protein